MTTEQIWAVIAGMALVNFAIRFLSLGIMSRMELPDWLRRWLSLIPVAAMATLVVGGVLRPNGSWFAGHEPVPVGITGHRAGVLAVPELPRRHARRGRAFCGALSAALG